MVCNHSQAINKENKMECLQLDARVYLPPDAAQEFIPPDAAQEFIPPDVQEFIPPDAQECLPPDAQEIIPLDAQECPHQKAQEFCQHEEKKELLYRQPMEYLFRSALIGCRRSYANDGFSGYLNKKLKTEILKCVRYFCVTELPKHQISPILVAIFGGVIRDAIIVNNAWSNLSLEERRRLDNVTKNILESKNQNEDEREGLLVDADLVCTGKGDIDLFVASERMRVLFLEYMGIHFEVREKSIAYHERSQRYSGQDVLTIDIGIKHNFFPLEYRPRVKIDCVVQPPESNLRSQIIPAESTLSTLCTRGDGTNGIFPPDGRNNYMYYCNTAFLPWLLGGGYDAQGQASVREQQCVALLRQGNKNKYGIPTLVSPLHYMLRRHPLMVVSQEPNHPPHDGDDDNDIENYVNSVLQYVMTPEALLLYTDGYLRKMLRRFNKLSRTGHTFRAQTHVFTNSEGAMSLKCTSQRGMAHDTTLSRISELVYVQGSTTIYAQCGTCGSQYPFTTFCDVKPVYSLQEIRSGIVSRDALA